MINFDAISSTDVTREPFQFFATPNVLDGKTLTAVGADFPAIKDPGIFPLSELTFGANFEQLIDDIRSSELEDILSEKFDVDLAGRPQMITVRGFCQKKDGRIHTDSEDKIVTCLLYLNAPWQETSGQLRLLRNGSDIEDMITEIPPNGGTLVAFKRSDKSFHGHKRYIGPRRYIMFNWVQSRAILAKNIGRHKLSSKIKKLNPFS